MEMKRVLITMMLGMLLTSIPVIADARNEGTARTTVSATSSPEPARPQYRRRYYRRRYPRHVRYVMRPRYYRPHYRRVHVYRRRRHY
jgi:hypothetical protein